MNYLIPTRVRPWRGCQLEMFKISCNLFTQKDNSNSIQIIDQKKKRKKKAFLNI